MTGYALSWGAHLLLWVFPLVVVVAAVLAFLGDRRRAGQGR